MLSGCCNARSFTTRLTSACTNPITCLATHTLYTQAAGMVVHPGPGHPGGTLVNAVLAHCDLPPTLLPPGSDVLEKYVCFILLHAQSHMPVNIKR